MAQVNLKSLSSIHKAMLMGQIIFAGIAIYLSYAGIFVPGLENQDKILQVIAIVLCAAGLYSGKILFNKKIDKARDRRLDVKSKFNAYCTASIIQWALLEGPCLFTIICFLITGNYAFLALAIFMIVFFGMLSPNKVKIGIQLQINEQDISEL